MHNFTIQSHSGPYNVEFNNSLIDSNELYNLGTHYIIDKNLVNILGKHFYENTKNKSVIMIDATEETKSYSGIEYIITFLIENNLKKDSHLVAIGGGITQDITCFIANSFMRGISWTFVPTTLLAQADSCIGSKSSINFGNYKNILGSFTPPNRVIICDKFLSTLEEKDVKSGIGEILKLYFVDGKLVDSNTIRQNLSLHLYNTLQIKKTFIEADEFDKNVRNILNYGHCFGHAIESATNFGVPHGIAVTMGMDIANLLAVNKGMLDKEVYHDMHCILISNYQDFKSISINSEATLKALGKDKKNTGNKLNVILPVHDHLEKFGFEHNNETLELFKSVFDQTPINFVD